MVVCIVRDGALQPVAAFSTSKKAREFIDSQGVKARGWDVEEFIIDELSVRPVRT